MRDLQCIILTRDPIYSVLLEMTIREHGFFPRLTAKIELVEKWSSTNLTVAWFIDLDQLPLSVEEVATKARLKAPDVKLVFFSSNFSRELAQSCLKQQALALLVKPVVIPRLIQTLTLLRQEMELIEHDDILPSPDSDKAETDTRETAPRFDDHPFLRKVPLKCPVCARSFEALAFKLWTVPISDTDTDFCPICPDSVHPELYTTVVCPGCLYAHYVGKFPQVMVSETARQQFLRYEALEERKKLSFNLEFTGERTILHGIKSFELAAIGCQDLNLRGALKLAGEFYLKCSWLSRRVGHTVHEQESQERALDCLKRVYAPYHTIDNKPPAMRAVSTRLGLGMEPLNERGIIVTCFLVGELSRRLGNLEQARHYFDETLSLPFLSRYSSLLSHVHSVNNLLKKQMGTASPHG